MEISYIQFNNYGLRMLIKNYLIVKLHNGGLTMKKDIYSNIKDSDALESFLNV